jgi:hypothetical protein
LWNEFNYNSLGRQVLNDLRERQEPLEAIFRRLKKNSKKLIIVIAVSAE